MLKCFNALIYVTYFNIFVYLFIAIDLIIFFKQQIESFIKIKVFNQKIVIIFVYKLLSHNFIFENIQTFVVFNKFFKIDELNFESSTTIKHSVFFNAKLFCLNVCCLKLLNQKLYWFYWFFVCFFWQNFDVFSRNYYWNIC